MRFPWRAFWLFVTLASACQPVKADPDDAGPPPDASACGNRHKDPGEACDGPDLGIATCMSAGFPSGTLACTSTCSLDTSGCEVPPDCGNHQIGGSEQCDGDQLGDATCASLGFFGGTLACGGGCRYDTTGCSNCGDGDRDPGEGCDHMDFGGQTCATAGTFEQGTLACRADCSLDTSSCIHCGDGHAQGSEACDGSDLHGKTCTSIDQGFVGGTLACANDCSFDVSGCTAPPNCPNGEINAGEQCDGQNLNGATCSSATGGTLPTGTLTCGSGCQFDTHACYKCGDGALAGPEVCDGSNLAGQTCVARGHDGGTLTCASNCLGFNENACSDCGDGRLESPELCDGDNLNGRTCADVGPFSGGTLHCNGSCDGFVTTGCLGGPNVPQLRSPLNNAYFGSSRIAGTRRPTFVWAASSSPAGSITYTLQYSTDPSFGAAVTTSVTTSFTSHRPAADLAVSPAIPVGARYYWRVKACAGNACSAFSSPYWLNVGRSNHDFNGDGFADVWVAADQFDRSATLTNTGRAFLYLGGTSVSTTPVHTFDGEGAGDQLAEFGALAYVGDLNADGFADVAIGSLRNDAAGMSAGRAYLFLGNASASVASPIVLTGAAAGDQFGSDLAGAGDVNGDGFDDLMIGAPRSDLGGTDAGLAQIYFGGTSFNTTADLRIVGVGTGGLGDVNGDGFADVWVGAAGGSPGGLYLGGPNMDSQADAQMASFPAFGVGDINGDGFGDFVERFTGCIPLGSCSHSTSLRKGGPDVSNLAALGTGDAAATDWGYDQGSAGDFNGDGLTDLVVADRVAKNAADVVAGKILIYFGGPTMDGMPDFSIFGNGSGEQLGYQVANGDVNGDGREDLIVSALGSGKVLVYFSSTTPNNVADVTLTGTVADRFGISLD
jgi:FG-GAP repeat